jgi:hypothetical protein
MVAIAAGSTGWQQLPLCQGAGASTDPPMPPMAKVISWLVFAA